jgi:TIR domain
MAESAIPSPGRIFISYRREETAYPAGWLFDRLAEHFGAEQVFKDVDSIQLGDDFVAVLTRAVGSCDVLLALIGDEWLTITDEDGRRRLDDPDDFLRLEIEAALARGVRVIPILVDGAPMPHAAELPASLAKLVRRQALELSPARFDSDTGRLIKVLDKTLAELQTAHEGAASDSRDVTAPQDSEVRQQRSSELGPQLDRQVAGEDRETARARHEPHTPSSPPGFHDRRRVLIAVSAGAVVVAAAVTAVVMLLPGGDTTATRTVKVLANKSWTPTPVICKKGDVLDITAFGQIRYKDVDPSTATGPNGDSGVNPRYYNRFLGANHGALIGSIAGDPDTYFLVGKGTTYTCKGAGRLLLGVNDGGGTRCTVRGGQNCLDNNSGEFTATIKYRKA